MCVVGFRRTSAVASKHFTRFRYLIVLCLVRSCNKSNEGGGDGRQTVRGLLNVAPASASVVQDRKLESAMMGSRMACVSCQIPRKFAVISVILMSLSTGTTLQCNDKELRIKINSGNFDSSRFTVFVLHYAEWKR